LLQGSSQLAAFVAGIGYYRPDSRKKRTQSAKQQSARTPCVTAGVSIQLRLNSNKCTKSDTEFARRGK
jgi:hypothetical protein